MTNSRFSPAQITDLLERTPRSSFVGGRFLGGTADLDVLDPATGAPLTQVVDADAPTIGAQALDAAVAAQDEWAKTLPRERSEILRRAYELCHERADDLAALMTLEMGKPLAESYGEVTYGAEFLRWFSEEAVRLPGRFRQAPSAQQAILTTVRPVGPVLAITPWNFPLSMGTRKIAPALAAGCTVVLKPAQMTPLTSLAFAQILADAGVPAGVVNVVVTSDSSGLSSTLMSDARLRKVSFTGSTSVGRSLLSQASEHVLRTSMELGGNAPFLVLGSADIEVAVSAAMLAKYRNNGEACTAANRFYVHSSVAEQFTKRLVEETEKLQVGAGIAEGTTMGPMIEPKALDKIEELVTDAVDRGARLLTGGKRLGADELGTEAAGGFFYAPTVLADVPADARVNHEEIFGPVAPVIVMDDVEDMVRAANDTEFGLMSYVAGGDLAEITDVAGRIESGMVAVNVGVASDAAAPFGGVKESGLGREGSHEGIAEYLETSYIRLPL
ncbi:NAD-dependent succinate-semialdehyde dehydrogenase [Brachybacterium endophyticum]|uniref:NAD-dependent succinate-semialdehyde dehydrogenase n=1 Tax=Brachybacterium endophyticum TaxID=2182385 RepID=A0A2U2RNG0_9MICO|nr:NAD-dependent succinate-semialdehyde dehydrogenase [Brachybacterium endophyticum]PWH07366.1 NAD-dependent succinate-semialdehyde dehydrogenase [Brachybacterium endophyticum]